MTVEVLEIDFFHPVGGKVRIPIVPGSKTEIPKKCRVVSCKSQKVRGVSPAQPETEIYTTVLTKHKLLVTSYIHFITSLYDA